MDPKFYLRFFNDPQHHYFLLGPRGTGKSTWIRRHYDHYLLIDLLDPEIVRRYHIAPERLREVVRGEPHKRVIIIDEVQRVPELLTVVHSLIEEKGEQQFILTGSSARKLKRKAVDLLAGRAVVRHMHPFMAAELQAQFSLESALQMGLLPIVLDANNPRDVLAAYVTTYLYEEVQAEGLVRNIGSFARFLEIVSFSHGSVLNASHIARECAMERKVVSAYIGILEDLLLAFRIPVFTKRAKRHLSSHAKFYLFDAGVYRALRPAGPLDRPEEMQGYALEGLVAQHLRAWIDYSGSQSKLYFWRTRKGTEVDFIVYGPDQFVAIEVKNVRQVFSKDLRSLKTFKTDYPECQVVLLYRGEERLLIDEILCLPCEAFLVALHPGQKLLSVHSK